MIKKSKQMRSMQRGQRVTGYFHGNKKIGLEPRTMKLVFGDYFKPDRAYFSEAFYLDHQGVHKNVRLVKKGNRWFHEETEEYFSIQW